MTEYFEQEGITFEWDPDKNQSNIEKHGVSFVEAVQVFFDPFLKVVDASDRGEAREAVIGMDESWRILFVVHVAFEQDAVRIISARKAERKERKYYED
jgi:uncharacterized protein